MIIEGYSNTLKPIYESKTNKATPLAVAKWCGALAKYSESEGFILEGSRYTYLPNYQVKAVSDGKWLCEFQPIKSRTEVSASVVESFIDLIDNYAINLITYAEREELPKFAPEGVNPTSYYWNIEGYDGYKPDSSKSKSTKSTKSKPVKGLGQEITSYVRTHDFDTRARSGNLEIVRNTSAFKCTLGYNKSSASWSLSVVPKESMTYKEFLTYCYLFDHLDEVYNYLEKFSKEDLESAIVDLGGGA